MENIKRDVRGIGLDSLDWIYLPQQASCEHGDKLSGSLKCWEVPEWLHNWQLLKKGSAP
jgi:hypothetical protein